MFAGIANCSGFQDIFYSLDNTSVLAGSGTLTGKGVFLTPQGSFVGSGTLTNRACCYKPTSTGMCRYAQPGRQVRVTFGLGSAGVYAGDQGSCSFAMLQSRSHKRPALLCECSASVRASDL